MCSTYCQKNISDDRFYLDFIVSNQLDILSPEDFGNKLNKIKTSPTYIKSYCCWLLSKIRQNEKYEYVHALIDSFAEEDECMKFYLSPLDYDKKEQVNVEWILTTGDEGVPALVKIPEYKEKLKQYIYDDKFMDHNLRNKIVNVL